MLCFPLFLYSESVLCSTRNTVRQLDYGTSKSHSCLFPHFCSLSFLPLSPTFLFFKLQPFLITLAESDLTSSEYLEDIATTSQMILLVSYYGNFCSLLDEIAWYFGKIHRANLVLNLSSCHLLIMWLQRVIYRCWALVSFPVKCDGFSNYWK